MQQQQQLSEKIEFLKSKKYYCTICVHYINQKYEDSDYRSRLDALNELEMLDPTLDVNDLQSEYVIIAKWHCNRCAGEWKYECNVTKNIPRDEL